MAKSGFVVPRPAARLTIAAFLAVGATAGISAAQSPKHASKPPATAQQRSENGTPETIAAEAPKGQAPGSAETSAGLKVVKDPETGKLRGPDRAEAAKMSGPAMNRSIEGLQAVRLPGGVTLVDLQGRFQSYSVATKKPGGGIEIECHSTEPGHNHEPHANSEAQASPAKHDVGNVSTGNVHGK